MPIIGALALSITAAAMASIPMPLNMPCTKMPVTSVLPFVDRGQQKADDDVPTTPRGYIDARQKSGPEGVPQSKGKTLRRNCRGSRGRKPLHHWGDEHRQDHERNQAIGRLSPKVRCGLGRMSDAVQKISTG